MRNQATNQTTINLPIETKKEVKILAAELNLSMGNAALELIKLGLAEYKKNPLYADRNSVPMGAISAEATN